MFYTEVYGIIVTVHKQETQHQHFLSHKSYLCKLEKRNTMKSDGFVILLNDVLNLDTI